MFFEIKEINYFDLDSETWQALKKEQKGFWVIRLKADSWLSCSTDSVGVFIELQAWFSSKLGVIEGVEIKKFKWDYRKKPKGKPEESESNIAPKHIQIILFVFNQGLEWSCL